LAPLSVLRFSDRKLTQVAIFGAKGKIVTPENELLQFHIRHCLDREPQPKYRLHATVEEKPSGPVSELDLRDQDVASGDDLEHYQRRVLDLTQQAESMGLERAMRLFLTRSAGNGHKEHASNGV
jgi:hypothetical protein